MGRFQLGLALLAAGCGGVTPQGRDGGAAPPDASCEVTFGAPPVMASPHVAVGSPIEWSSNPPSSGPHYPQWAAFQEYSSPVPRGYYVHNLEHGAVVLLYNCALLPDGGSCDELRQGLRQVAEALPADPLCSGVPGVRTRVVVSPDPLITKPVAAAAWGNTYLAACLDAPSLEWFAREHYAHAAENECVNGVTNFGP